MVLGDSTLRSLTPSVNAPLHTIYCDVNKVKQTLKSFHVAYCMDMYFTFLVGNL